MAWGSTLGTGAGELRIGLPRAPAEAEVAGSAVGGGGSSLQPAEAVIASERRAKGTIDRGRII
jgi:hypothetical protein